MPPKYNLSLDEIVNLFQSEDKWMIGNEVLYNLCQCFPDHTNEQASIAKIWLIGRSYAAAVERRKTSSEKKELDAVKQDFYIEKVWPALQKANSLNLNMMKLKVLEGGITSENEELILQTHTCLVEELEKITYQRKQSLASKYLHFHFPNLFFIYDTRAKEALASIVGPYNRNSYASFFRKLQVLQDWVAGEIQQSLPDFTVTPRQMDRLLLEVHTQRRL